MNLNSFLQYILCFPKITGLGHSVRLVNPCKKLHPETVIYLKLAAVFPIYQYLILDIEVWDSLPAYLVGLLCYFSKGKTTALKHCVGLDDVY